MVRTDENEDILEAFIYDLYSQYTKKVRRHVQFILAIHEEKSKTVRIDGTNTRNTRNFMPIILAIHEGALHINYGLHIYSAAYTQSRLAAHKF
jgi:hypothetical protein